MENNTDLMEQFSRAMMLFHRYQHYSRKEQGPFADPNRGQGRILALLKMQPEISQKDLAYLLDMRNQSLSELLTKLEKAGYITRTQSQADRRVMDIKLTKQGEDAAGQSEQGKQGSGQIFDCLGEEERKNLSDYLARIITELDKQMGGEADFPDAWGPRGMMPELMTRLRENGALTPEMIEELRKHGGLRRGLSRGGFGFDRGRGGYPFDGFDRRGTPPPPPAPKGPADNHPSDDTDDE